MTNNQDSNDKFSLKADLKRRQGEELDRQIQERKSAKLQGNAPTGPKTLPFARPADRMPSGAPAKAPSQPRIEVGTPTLPNSNKALLAGFKNLSKAQKMRLYAAGIATFLLVAVLGVFMSAGNVAADSAAPVYTDIPLSDADTILHRFQALGIPISELKPYDLSTATAWKGAKAGYQFAVKRGKDLGRFILVSYDTADNAKADVFAAMGDGKHKSWDIQLLSNIVLSSTPATAQSIDSEMSSHFMTFLFAPYRAFWPTATALPTQIPATPVTAATKAK